MYLHIIFTLNHAVFINLYILLESIREIEIVHFLSSPAFLKYLRIVQMLLLVYLTTICTEKAIVLTFILEMSSFLKNNFKLMHGLQNSKTPRTSVLLYLRNRNSLYSKLNS